MTRLTSYFSTNWILWTLGLWQFVSVSLVAIGVWPQEIAWLNFVLISLYIIFSSPLQGLLVFIVSLPFYIVLPNPYFESLSMWRILIIVLFIVTFLKTIFHERHQRNQTTSFLKIPSLSSLSDLALLGKALSSRFMWWDKYLALLIVVAGLSMIAARFPGESLKQIIFLLNSYLVYVVVLLAVKSKEDFLAVLKSVTVSAAVIVLFGFGQLIATLFVEQYYFWQYWAIMVSKVYYGLGLSEVLAYSNSWFSYTSEVPVLRMFSILPDSHSFGMIAGLCLMLTTIFVTVQDKLSEKRKSRINFGFNSSNAWLFIVISLSSLAVIFSGTRGLWVGMLPVLILSLGLWFKSFSVSIMRRQSIALISVIVFFLLSPVLNQGLSMVRAGTLGDNFFSRAASIYDLNESSNAGRLEIWKNSAIYAIGHPFGVGYGNFIVSLLDEIPEGTSFENVGQLKNLRYNLPQKFVSAHSLYLNLLVELGVVGLLIFGLFCFEIFKRIWLFLKHSRPGEIFGEYAATFGLILLWFLAYGLFDVTLFNDRVLLYFFVLLALCGVALHAGQVTKGASPASER